MTVTQTNLAELYVSFFNRAPDSAGLAYWVDQLDKGVLSLEDISKNWMSEQAEGLAKYPVASTHTDFITQIYQAALGRAPDAEGLAYWQDQLTNNSVGRDVFLAAVINGAKANSSALGVLDAATLSNKATAGVAFADKGLNDLTLAGQVVASVNSNPDTLAAAQAVIKLVPATAASVTPALITLLSKTFDSIINLNAKAPGEVGDLATYLTAVANQAGGTTDLSALLNSVSNTVTKAATDSAALDNPASLAGDAVTAATPSTGGGDVPTTPSVTVIHSKAGSDVISLTSAAEKFVVSAGVAPVLADDAYVAAHPGVKVGDVVTPASDNYAPQVGTAQVGTPASSDYVAASSDYVAQVGTAQVGTPASSDYVAASSDYVAQVGTPQVGTPASSDYVAASSDYVAQVGTAQVGTPASSDYVAASSDYVAQVGTAQVGTPASSDYVAASSDYVAQVGTAPILVDQAYIDANPETTYVIGDTVPASDDYAPQVGTAQVGTAASDDYAAASDDYAPQVGTAQVGTPASSDYVAASSDYVAQVGTAQVGTAASDDYVAASDDYAPQVGTAQVGTAASDDYVAASDDYVPQVGTAQVGTAASDDYVAASDDYVPQVGTPAVLADLDYVAAHPSVQVGDVLTPGIASASSPFDHDILTGFSLSADKLVLPSTTLLNFAEGVGELFVSTVNKGMVTFGGEAALGASYFDKAEVLLTSMGTEKLSAAFVLGGDTYVVQGDGVAGVQGTDILIKLVGVTNVTDLGSIIV